MSRVLTSLCPACGAQVRFTGDSSLVVVCDYCSSTLVRRGQAIENLGKMAELFEDHSPLQLGARGEVDGVGLVLIGRLQYRHDRGGWNEWWARLDDDRTLWLSEDNGQYVLTRPAGPPQPVPAFETLQPGHAIQLAGASYSVASLTRASVVAGQGELPFVVAGGYEAPVVDLRNARGGFATLDYSDFAAGSAAAAPSRSASGEMAAAESATADSAPTVAAPTMAVLYVGRAVTLTELKMTGLRESLERQVATEAFSCPSCGAPVQPSLRSTLAITCPACAIVLDLGKGAGQRVDFVRQNSRYQPTLKIGSIGRLEDVAWTVVGFQRREGEVEDERFEWNEYLLHETRQGFRFLVEDRGHWSLARLLQAAPAARTTAWGRSQATLNGRVYDHFASYRSKVLFVEGEFYWEVRKDDRTVHAEYIAPPRGLSRELFHEELTWSESYYLPADQVATAFRLKSLPAPEGPGMLEPLADGGPWRRRYGWLAVAAVAVLLLMQLTLMFRGTEHIIADREPVRFDGTPAAEYPFVVAAGAPVTLVVSPRAVAPEDWYYLTVTVLDASAGQPPREIRREVAGPARAGAMSAGAGDRGGSDGSNSSNSGAAAGSSIAFRLEPGDYVARVAGSPNPAARHDQVADYSIRTTSRPHLLWFWLGLIGLVIANAFGYLGAPNPESERWSHSLYGSPPKRVKARRAAPSHSEKGKG